MINTKQKPFQQFQIPKPEGGMKGRWFRRHIVIDHRHKEIMIQIMWDGVGELRIEEYHDIVKGAWWSLVPKDRIGEYRQAIAGGYRVIPIVVAGGNDGEDHVVVQLIDITNTHNVIHDSSLAPLPE
jgi:hypothetical protein